MGNSKEDLLKTFLYFDIFDYPLKEKEIWYYFHGRKISKKDLSKKLKNKIISKIGPFFFVKGSRLNIKERKKREVVSKEKLNKAKKIIDILKIVPTVKFIGISGSLSMKNSTQGDDVDIFVICSKGYVWLTRMVLITVLKLNGLYRGREDSEYKDKICLNLILGENRMQLKGQRQNLYSAHEIVQLQPIFQKDSTYTKFIEKNEWVEKYLPNYMDKIRENNIVDSKTSLVDRISLRIFGVLLLEKLAKIIQFNYMRNKITQEEITDDFLAFHPTNYKNIVLEKLKEKYEIFNLRLV